MKTAKLRQSEKRLGDQRERVNWLTPGYLLLWVHDWPQWHANVLRNVKKKIAVVP